ncbi:MAG: RIP metalloprotease RseP [Bacilli bacterium]|nr:RIP metalloprotease RseP [Bacilli bacterium]
MNFIYFILVLSVTIFIHELGHFIFAKRAGIYVYEFALGMGPRIFKFNRKDDETTYSLRLFPIGGFVQMAGEEVELDEKIPENKRLQSKTWMQRFLTVIAGVVFNFLLAIVLFIICAIVAGVPQDKVIISDIVKEYPIESTNIQVGDEIVAINNKNLYDKDMFLLEFQINGKNDLNVTVRHSDNSLEDITIIPVPTDVDGKEVYKYGFSLDNAYSHNFFKIISYGFAKTWSLIVQMFYIIYYLIIGKLSLNSLSGPVGIYNIVGQSAQAGFINVVFLTGYLCVNVGFINLLPIPAFDGGRALFMIIEKIRRKPINAKVENTIHAVGLALLMILMVLVTWNDITKFFI